MSEIVERLRIAANMPKGMVITDTAMREAAAEIERLEALVVELTKEWRDECERRDEIIATTTKLWKDAEAIVERQRAALDEAEACMSIVEPRSDKAEYVRILGVVRAALTP